VIGLEKMQLGKKKEKKKYEQESRLVHGTEARDAA